MKYLLLFLLFITPYISHSWEYKSIPKKFRISVSDLEYERVRKVKFHSGVDLSKYLPRGYRKDGSVDYLAYLQRGVDENKVIILPNFPILINGAGLKLRSNTKVLFQKNSKLIVEKNSKESYYAMNLDNISNVEIFFAKLEGDRNIHLGLKGEWGMGLFIRSAQDVLIHKCDISDFWGDGIYIGEENGVPCNSINIYGAFLDNNRRNGISIISAKNFTMSNSVISNTNGTSPEYGIDIEPNDSQNRLDGVNFKNIISYNNKGGLLIALDNLQGNSSSVNVNVNNFKDFYSKEGVSFYIDRGYKAFKRPIKGKITLKNINLNTNKSPLNVGEGQKSEVHVELENVAINNKVVVKSQLFNISKHLKQGKVYLLK